MEIKDLSYKQFSLIRKAMLEKRENLWKIKRLEPFKKDFKKMSLDKIQNIKNHFITTTNQLSEEGICNKVLQNLDKIEINIKKELR